LQCKWPAFGSARILRANKTSLEWLPAGSQRYCFLRGFLAAPARFEWPEWSFAVGQGNWKFAEVACLLLE
jgi:hypothetical protein